MTPTTTGLEELLALHRTMLLIRRFEERAAELYRDSEIPGFLHLSIGQEAVAAGVCTRLRRWDAVVSTHRGHGHCIAKGVDVTTMFAELMGREAGACRGRGGSMHIADLETGVYGANGIVGAGLPIADGIATAFRILGRDDIVVAFFGEGAAAQGAFHEALNLAVVRGLPVLFVCENNGFAEFSRLEDQQPLSPHERAAGYRIPARLVDGNDVLAVARAVDELLPRLREGTGPWLLEARTLRGRGHYEGDPQHYRSPDEQAQPAAADPLARSAERIAELGGAEDLAALEADVAAAISHAVETAHWAPAPDPAEAARYVFTEAARPLPVELRPAGDDQKYVEALREALADAFDADPAVWLAGVDVGAGGGVFTVTRGLAERYAGRVVDTPISETALIGLAVGGALAGTRPVVELMYIDFVGVCLDQLLNQAAKQHFMSGGRALASLVVRTQCGAGRSSGPQHSQSLESLLTQIPGLKVVMPSTPADAYGLLRAAIEDPDPVVFIEHRLLYGKTGPRTPGKEHRVPIGRAATRRAGSDLTIVSWSRMAQEAVEAAGALAADGIEAEVLDLRTVCPLDREAIAASVARTHRLLIAHEAVMTSGVGAEIAAWAAAELFWSLDAPVVRVAPPFSPVPYSPSLEHAWLVGADDIAAAARRLCTT